MLHKSVLAGNIHVLANWVVADAAARLALTPVATDDGKMLWQQDDNSFWMLTDYTGPTWKPFQMGLDLEADSFTVADSLIAGDPGLEGSGIDVDGATYDSHFKVSDIGSSRVAQAIHHRHSDTLSPLIVGSRSRGTTTAHADVQNSDVLFGKYAVGYAGANYKIFGTMAFEVDSTGTVSGTSAPGAWRLQLTPDGSKVPANVMLAKNDKSVEFFGIAKGPTPANNINSVQFATTAFVRNVTAYDVAVACGDEATVHTTGTKVTFRAPRAFTLSSVKASLTGAQAAGSIFTVDVKKNGVSIFSTLLTIDNTELTSATAATPAVLSTTSIADDDVITIDITQIGTALAAGLKVYFKGYIT